MLEKMKVQRFEFPIFFLLAVFMIFLLTGCNLRPNAKKAEELRPVNLESTTPGQRQLPFKFGKEYKYTFYTFGKVIGTTTFRFEKDSTGNVKLFASTDFNDVEMHDKASGNSVMTFDSNWNLTGYERTLNAEYLPKSDLNGIYKVNTIFDNAEAFFEFTDPGKTPEKKDFALPGKIFLFDNMFTGQMAFICSQPELVSGRTEILDVLSISNKEIFKLSMIPKLKREMDFTGRKIVAYEVDMKVNDSTFGIYYIDRDGLLIRAMEEGGRLVMDLDLSSL